MFVTFFNGLGSFGFFGGCWIPTVTLLRPFSSGLFQCFSNTPVISGYLSIHRNQDWNQDYTLSILQLCHWQDFQLLQSKTSLNRGGESYRLPLPLEKWPETVQIWSSYYYNKPVNAPFTLVYNGNYCNRGVASTLRLVVYYHLGHSLRAIIPVVYSQRYIN